MPNSDTVTSIHWSRFQNQEVSQFMQGFLLDLDSLQLVYTSDPLLVALVGNLESQSDVFQLALKGIPLSDQAEKIRQADVYRDDDFIALKSVVNSFKNSRRPELAEASKSLRQLLNKQKKVTTSNYIKESGIIKTILEQLKDAKYKENIKTLGIQTYVDNLQESQTAFEGLFNGRSQDKLANPKETQTREARSRVQKTYLQLVNHVITGADNTTETFYPAIIQVINNTHDNFKEILSKRQNGQKDKTTPKKTDAETPAPESDHEA